MEQTRNRRQPLIWPTREEWKSWQNHKCPRPSAARKDYATPAEIEEGLGALQKLLRHELRRTGHNDERRGLRRLIACFQSGDLRDLYNGDHPRYEQYDDLSHLVALDHLLSPAVLSILARIEAAADHAERAGVRSVDDEAWQEELRRRCRAEGAG